MMTKREGTLLRSEDRAPVAESRRRAVIRYVDGHSVRGFLYEDEQEALTSSGDEAVDVETHSGKRLAVRVSEIKAIFLVRSFEGSRDYSEFKVFSSRPTGKGVWVRVHFRDGEVLEGVAPNSLETFSRPVFYMTPPDPASNNQAVLVSKNYLKQMQILGIGSD